MTAFPWLPCITGFVFAVSAISALVVLGALMAARDITVDDGEW